MLLAVDTSTQWMGLALLHDDQIISETVWKTHNHHSVELAPAVALLFKRADITTNALEAIAIASGPGSFTSLRVGMAFVKGLALSLHLPLISIPTLHITAAAVPMQDLPLAAVLQAGRGRLAVGWYGAGEDGWRPTCEPEVMTPAELEQAVTKPALICGELNTEERKTLARRWKNIHLVEAALCVRRPAYLAQMAFKRWLANDVDDAVSLAPTYLHLKDPIPG
ncbi:MAG: tRNA (adenosine(37)-N6)-threonylcarbamoyltransferase complex dimerization subunit type 1 TsaB [Anaerolinea sp.]|nr:tRNA (adenosine(37)-N6)-threonylcarbamoyltransferase complex dimerization subunit type 1 TsaB [Anaerolinea sp.]